MDNAQQTNCIQQKKLVLFLLLRRPLLNVASAKSFFAFSVPHSRRSTAIDILKLGSKYYQQPKRGNMRVKIILILVFVLIFGGSQAFASDNSHRGAAEELLLLTGADKMLDQVWGQLETLMNQQFQQMGATEEQKPILDNYTKKLVIIYKEEFNWSKLKDDFIDIYVRTYSEQELLEISEFYKTPAGRKFVQKMPQLIQESMAVSQKNVQPLMKKLQKLTEEMSAEIEKAKEGK